MATLVISFDSYYGIESYEGKQALAQFRNAPGVKGMKAYRAVDSKPVYNVEVDVEDDKLEDLKKRIQGQVAGYSGYVSNFSMKVLKEIPL